MKTKIKFYPEEKNDINKIISKIFKFGKIYKEKFLDDIYENPILEVEISSLNEELPNCFSFVLNGFTKEKYDNYCPKQIKYKDEDLIAIICLEGKNEESINSLFDLFSEFLSKILNGYSLKFSLRKDKNKLYIEFKNKYEEEKFDDIYFNINEFSEISVMFRNNFKIDEFLDMSFEQFFTSFFSLIFSINIRFKNLQSLILYIEKKYMNDNDMPLLIAIINWIKAVINSKIEFNFSPNKILDF